MRITCLEIEKTGLLCYSYFLWIKSGKSFIIEVFKYRLRYFTREAEVANEMENTTSVENEETKQNGADQEAAHDGKVVRKTYLEIREEARRAILPAHDREKYETLDPADREFLDAACLFEFNQQQVQKTRRRIKLRDIMLCRDVAQAYCPGRDATGQYSEGKRILKNSEAGSETVRFVLSRKICSMLERIYNLYNSHPRNYVSADVHKAESELLNYTGRLGKIIRDPLKEARRIYLKLKERTGWEIAPTAFDNAEGCDVPQLFFNRYSDSNQLLLKDPMKPFRSDNMVPPLNLDYRIKNAVLIMAGENRFFVDKKKFAAVRETATARAIALKSITEARMKITDDYKRNIYQLEEHLNTDADFNVRSVKEAAFNFFYGYTLKDLPNTAARADAAELMAHKLMAEENDIGCNGFCHWVFPPGAVNDDAEPAGWSPAVTQAYKLRKLFNGLATGELRMAMFATGMTELLSEYLDRELQRIVKEIAGPYDARLKRMIRDRQQFISAHQQELDELKQAEARIGELHSECGALADEAFVLVNEIFSKPIKADGCEARLSALKRIRERLEKENVRRGEMADTLKRKYQTLVARNNELISHVKQIGSLAEDVRQRSDEQEIQRQVEEIIQQVSGLIGAEKTVDSLKELRKLAMQRLEQIRAALGKLKTQHAAAVSLKNKLGRIMECLESVDTIREELETLESRSAELAALPEKLAGMERSVDSVSTEREDAVGRIEEMIEVSKET